MSDLIRLPVQFSSSKAEPVEEIKVEEFFHSTGGKSFRGRPIHPVEFIPENAVLVSYDPEKASENNPNFEPIANIHKIIDYEYNNHTPSQLTEKLQTAEPKNILKNVFSKTNALSEILS